MIRDWLENLPNLALAGRNGMHKYNNQDHSMMTAVLVARNILGLGELRSLEGQHRRRVPRGRTRGRCGRQDRPNRPRADRLGLIHPLPEQAFFAHPPLSRGHDGDVESGRENVTSPV